MISYEQFCQIRKLVGEDFSHARIASEMSLNERTVAYWAGQEKFRPRKSAQRPSKLDPFKGRIVKLLAEHPYSVEQLLQRLREEGYSGRRTILAKYVRMVRPKQKQAYLSLSFAPGECAQVDWGSYGGVNAGETRRRLSFFVMVLGFSRMLYVAFTLSEKMEHFLQCHLEAFEFFGGVPQKVLIDNLKCGVLERPPGQPIRYNPHYLDFSRHYGFEPVACNVAKGNEKGRVENAVGYVKKNFLSGLRISDFKVLGPAAQTWMDQVANVREHGTTHRPPTELFQLEKPQLTPLPIHRYNVSVTQTVRVNKCFRITVDSNRYSVPFEYAGQLVELKRHPHKLQIFHNQRLIAEHVRSYDRHRDYENPDHVVELLQQKRRARRQHQLSRFLMLSPVAERYYKELQARRLNAAHHVEKILALAEIYGQDKTARALADTAELGAYSCEYLANLLEQREKPLPEPGALHLTRREDLLDLELPAANLDLYGHAETSTRFFK